MYFFDKKTEYLIWNIQDGQARGVGTVRFLVMDDVCRGEIVITGCGKVQGTYPVYVLSGPVKSLWGEIALEKGKGRMAVKCSANGLGHEALPYRQVTGVHIDLGTEGTLSQKWLPVGMVESEDSTATEYDERVDVKPRENVSGGTDAGLDGVMAEEPGIVVAAEPKTATVAEPEAATAAMADAESVVEGRPANEAVRPPEKKSFELYGNKWQQLCVIYPVVHPFSDERAYLSIEPRDFVVLQERFQPLVRNSFLLHGFYHYRHLLLGRQRQGKYFQYYLGVPGVFYEKEKAAAMFYGFESFECATAPAVEGSFGYYMKRVQI